MTANCKKQGHREGANIDAVHSGLWADLPEPAVSVPKVGISILHPADYDGSGN